MRINEKYFLGGWNPDHPSQNVQYKLIDNEDGTGEQIEYFEDGSFKEQVHLTNLPLPAPEQDSLQVVFEILSQLDPHMLKKVVALGVALTDANAVAVLEQAVEQMDAVAGIEVVKDAVLAANEEVENG